MSEKSKMFGVKIELSKIDKGQLFVSEKTGRVYLDAVMFLNDSDQEPDQYGNVGAIIQSYPKESRPEKNLYIGNIQPLKKSDEPEGDRVDEKTGEIKTDDEIIDDLPF